MGNVRLQVLLSGLPETEDPAEFLRGVIRHGLPLAPETVQSLRNVRVIDVVEDERCATVLPTGGWCAAGRGHSGPCH